MMIRLLLTLFIIFLLNSCRQPENKEQTNINSKDSLEQIANPSVQIEDFDALVNKYEDPNRVNWQNPEIVFTKMGDLAGKTVADIGTGSGYFAFRLIRKGADVIGIDIEPKFLDYIEARKSEITGVLKDRITTRLAKEDDPLLQNGEVDYVLIVNTYFYLGDRLSYLRKVRNGLKNGGKLIVVDYKAGDLPVGPANDMKVSIEKANTEITAQGFKIIEIDKESLQYQYIIVAER